MEKHIGAPGQQLAVMPGYELHLPVLNREINLLSRILCDTWSCVVLFNYLRIVFFCEGLKTFFPYNFLFKLFVLIVGQRDTWPFLVSSPPGSVVSFPPHWRIVSALHHTFPWTLWFSALPQSTFTSKSPSIHPKPDILLIPGCAVCVPSEGTTLFLKISK